MIEYQKLDVVYTTQWPFNHFQLNEDDYITEEMAQNTFEKKAILWQYISKKVEEQCVSFLEFHLWKCSFIIVQAHIIDILLRILVIIIKK